MPNLHLFFAVVLSLNCITPRNQTEKLFGIPLYFVAHFQPLLVVSLLSNTYLAIFNESSFLNGLVSTFHFQFPENLDFPTSSMIGFFLWPLNIWDILYWLLSSPPFLRFPQLWWEGRDRDIEGKRFVVEKALQYNRNFHWRSPNVMFLVKPSISRGKSKASFILHWDKVFFNQVWSKSEAHLFHVLYWDKVK